MRNCNMQNSNMPNYNMSDGTMRMREPGMPEQRMSDEMGCYMRENDSYRCDSYPIGMAYVPWQEFREIYDMERALEVGTIFEELDKPFLGRRAFRR